MTIRELKEMLADWPDEAANGEPYEVWMAADDSRYTNEARAVKLNEGDLLFERERV